MEKGKYLYCDEFSLGRRGKKVRILFRGQWRR